MRKIMQISSLSLYILAFILLVMKTSVSISILVFLSAGLFLIFYFKKMKESTRIAPHEMNLFLIPHFLMVLVMLSIESEIGLVLLVFSILALAVVKVELISYWGATKLELDEVEKKLTKINVDFREVRAQRHDFLKHTAALEQMINKQKTADVDTYSQQLFQDYQNLNHVIKGESGAMVSVLFTYNELFKQHLIEWRREVEIPLSELPLKQVDQMSLLTNLFDNAFEAAKDYQEKAKKDASIFLQTEKRSGIYLLRLSNSALFENRHLLDTLFEKFGVTTKEEGHEGLGTYIISKLVKGHHGQIDYYYDKNLFTVRIKLPLIKEVGERTNKGEQ
ncbi:sensor histidine kinase [Alkalihalobacillus sp. 1P02AB]|uniref:sensor histidine kinase n=1 Tax=Alkalihalobacillus sp. 1P02AB TaxID=3132260 RepID=UPI0039A4DF04